MPFSQTGSFLAWNYHGRDYYRRINTRPVSRFCGWYELETLALGVPFMAAFLDPGAWGRSFTAAMDMYENMAGLWIVGEDMPQETNAVTLNNDVKDQYGLPAPNVHFSDHPNDIAMRNHAWGQAKKCMTLLEQLERIQLPRILQRITLGPTGCRPRRKMVLLTSGAKPTTLIIYLCLTVLNSLPVRLRIQH